MVNLDDAVVETDIIEDDVAEFTHTEHGIGQGEDDVAVSAAEESSRVATIEQQGELFVCEGGFGSMVGS